MYVVCNTVCSADLDLRASRFLGSHLHTGVGILHSVIHFLHSSAFFCFEDLEVLDMALSNKSVAVIGAGISGVVTAAHLKNEGLDITVFERSSAAGGIW